MPISSQCPSIGACFNPMSLLTSVSQRFFSTSPLRGRGQTATAPPHLTNPKRFPYGAFRFDIQLSKGVPYAVHASSDLVTWTEINRDITCDISTEFLDSSAHKYGHRFYQATCHGPCASNVLGYASTTVSPGYSMVANPFTGGSNHVEEVLAGWPEGTAVTRFDPAQFRLKESVLEGGKWTLSGERFVPGEGSILLNPTSNYITINFAGEVSAGAFSSPVPAGFSIRSCMGPLFGRIREDLHFPIVEGDVIHLFDRDRQSYSVYEFQNGKWDKDPPVIGLCESFWVGKSTADNWHQQIYIHCADEAQP